MPHIWDVESVSPEEALDRLLEGNRRFREGERRSGLRDWSEAQRIDVQRPFAIILACSDSRLPVEILFDQGFGDLFVVRVAGNIVAPSIVGSIEFAASQFGTRLVVVLGHSRCGAVTATVEALESGLGPASRNIRDITDRIAPHIQSLPGTGSREEIVDAAVKANVRAAVDHLRHGSRLLEELVLAGRVAVVGAEYALESGAVEVLEPWP